MYGLRLETEYCPDGVELDDDGIFRNRTARRFPLKLETTNLENPHILQLINARDDDALAQFFGRYGFFDLGVSEYARAKVLTIQRKVRALLAAAGSDQAKDAAKALNSRLTNVRAGDTGVIPAVDGQLLSLKVMSLSALLYMECMMVIEKDTRLTACEHCEVYLLTGATTGRRSHAKFCSDRCRVAAMRVRQKA